VRVGIAHGFNALFGKLDTEWLSKVLATGFILVATAFSFAAQHCAASA